MDLDKLEVLLYTSSACQVAVHQQSIIKRLIQPLHSPLCFALQLRKWAWTSDESQPWWLTTAETSTTKQCQVEYMMTGAFCISACTSAGMASPHPELNCPAATYEHAHEHTTALQSIACLAHQGMLHGIGGK